MPRDLATNLNALGVVSSLAALTTLLWLIRRTPVRLAALAATLVTVVLVRSATPALRRYCAQGAPHVDCVPDRFEYVLHITKKLLGRGEWLDLPVLLALLVVVLAVAFTRRSRIRTIDEGR